MGKTLKNRFPIRLDYWQSNIEIWTRIFNELEISSKKTIVDLCPGWAPKIEVALSFTEFKGDIYALDSSFQNLQLFRDEISQYKFGFHIFPKKINLFNTAEKLDIKKVDLIVGNHIIDDIILNNFIRGGNKIYEKVGLFKNVAVKITPSFVKKITESISIGLDKIATAETCILLSQYLSYQEKLYSIEILGKKCNDALLKIAESLSRKGYIDKKYTLRNVFKNIENPYFDFDNIIFLQKSV